MKHTQPTLSEMWRGAGEEHDQAEPTTEEINWARLKQICPAIARLGCHKDRRSTEAVSMTRREFSVLVRCFADPTKRDILRTLILDLLKDDLVELIQGITKEGG